MQAFVIDVIEAAARLLSLGAAAALLGLASGSSDERGGAGVEEYTQEHMDIIQPLNLGFKGHYQDGTGNVPAELSLIHISEPTRPY